MQTFLMILILVFMLATFGVMMAGVFGMARRRDSAVSMTSNKMMRWRIILQAVTLALFALFMSIYHHG